MIAFEQLFGIPANQVKKPCILTPYLTKGLNQGLGIEDLHRGSPFASGQAENFTLIHTQIGAPFVGDAVLYLADSPCEQLIFFGACGAVIKKAGLDIGSIVSPRSSLNCESFSQLLDNTINPEYASHPDKNLFSLLTEGDDSIVPVNCASFGSFKLEENYLEFLKENKIDVMEMEACAFFNAARHTQKQALAVLYITDILNDKHVFEPMTPPQQSIIHIAQQKIFLIIQKFTEQLKNH